MRICRVSLKYHFNVFSSQLRPFVGVSSREFSKSGPRRDATSKSLRRIRTSLLLGWRTWLMSCLLVEIPRRIPVTMATGDPVAKGAPPHSSPGAPTNSLLECLETSHRMYLCTRPGLPDTTGVPTWRLCRSKLDPARTLCSKIGTAQNKQRLHFAVPRV